MANFYCNTTQFRAFLDQRLGQRLSTDGASDPNEELKQQQLLDSAASHIDSYLSGLWTGPSQPSLIILATPPAAPAATTIPGGTSSAWTAYIMATYVTWLGETTGSKEFSVSVPANSLLRVASVPVANGPSGWNCYIGTATGQEQLQNSVPLLIGQPYQQQQAALSSGSAPPISNSGYFAPPILTRMTAVLACGDMFLRRASTEEFASLAFAIDRANRWLQMIVRNQTMIPGATMLPTARPSLISSNDFWGKSQFDQVPFFDDLVPNTDTSKGRIGMMGISNGGSFDGSVSTGISTTGGLPL